MSVIAYIAAISSVCACECVLLITSSLSLPFCVDRGKREKRLVELLNDYHSSRSNRVLVFVLYKREAGVLAEYLQRKGFKANAISGDRTQAQRSAAIEQFRSGEVPILVATDVAARGLDVKNVTHVINCECDSMR